MFHVYYYSIILFLHIRKQAQAASAINIILNKREEEEEEEKKKCEINEHVEGVRNWRGESHDVLSFSNGQQNHHG
jgi:hypothetical protein